MQRFRRRLWRRLRRRLPLRLWGLPRLRMQRMRRGLVGSLWRGVCCRRRLLHILGRLQLLLGAEARFLA